MLWMRSFLRVDLHSSGCDSTLLTIYTSTFLLQEAEYPRAAHWLLLGPSQSHTYTVCLHDHPPFPLSGHFCHSLREYHLQMAITLNEGNPFCSRWLRRDSIDLYCGAKLIRWFKVTPSRTQADAWCVYTLKKRGYPQLYSILNHMRGKSQCWQSIIQVITELWMMQRHSQYDISAWLLSADPLTVLMLSYHACLEKNSPVIKKSVQ